MRAAAAVGIVLGILSRVEERTAGFSVGISSDSAWVTAAFVAGAATRRPWPAVVALTVANAAYYAWVAATEPGVPLASVAGSPVVWVALGVLTGVVFGAAGVLWRSRGVALRLAASLPLAAVLVAEGAQAIAAGNDGAAIGLAAGLAIPLASAPARPVRALAATAALAVLGATGVAQPLLP